MSCGLRTAEIFVPMIDHNPRETGGRDGRERVFEEVQDGARWTSLQCIVDRLRIDQECLKRFVSRKVKASVGGTNCEVVSQGCNPRETSVPW